MEIFNDFLQNTLPHWIFALIILVVGFWLSKLLVKIVYRMLDKSKADFTVVSFITSILKVVLIFVVGIAVLAEAGVNVASIITALAAAMVTAGLALQSSLSNIASGVVIIFNKPFKAGDVIEFENMRGTVQDIRLFYTTLLSAENKIITIPNSRLTSNNIINRSTSDTRRLSLKYTISYHDDITKVKGLLYSYIATLDKIQKEPEPAVYVGEHKASGIEILVHLWITEDDYWDMYYLMQEEVKKLFDDNGITIPYDQIVVHNQSSEK